MRNLEEEYKKSQQEKTPDLWKKIEAGLPEKKKLPKRMHLVRYMGVAAAALFFCALIPGLRYLGSGNTSNNSAANDREAQMEQADSAAPVQAEEMEPQMDFAAQNAVSDEENFTNDAAVLQDGLQEDIQDNAMPDAVLSELESMENAVNGIHKDVLEVAGSTWYGEWQVYTLRTQEGEEYKAVFPAGAERELQEGESYTFTMEAVEGEVWGFVIQTAE